MLADPLRSREGRTITTVQIELPGEQAAALKAKLSVQGLSLERWFQKLAEAETPSQTPLSAQDTVARTLDLQKRAKSDPEGWTVKDYVNHGRP
jgi:hypothetical protein